MSVSVMPESFFVASLWSLVDEAVKIEVEVKSAKATYLEPLEEKLSAIKSKLLLEYAADPSSKRFEWELWRATFVGWDTKETDIDAICDDLGITVQEFERKYVSKKPRANSVRITVKK